MILLKKLSRNLTFLKLFKKDICKKNKSIHVQIENKYLLLKFKNKLTIPNKTNKLN